MTNGKYNMQIEPKDTRIYEAYNPSQPTRRNDAEGKAISKKVRKHYSGEQGREGNCTGWERERTTNHKGKWSVKGGRWRRREGRGSTGRMLKGRDGD